MQGNWKKGETTRRRSCLLEKGLGDLQLGGDPTRHGRCTRRVPPFPSLLATDLCCNAEGVRIGALEERTAERGIKRYPIYTFLVATHPRSRSAHVSGGAVRDLLTARVSKKYCNPNFSKLGFIHN